MKEIAAGYAYSDLLVSKTAAFEPNATYRIQVRSGAGSNSTLYATLKTVTGAQPGISYVDDKTLRLRMSADQTAPMVKSVFLDVVREDTNPDEYLGNAQTIKVVVPVTAPEAEVGTGTNPLITSANPSGSYPEGEAIGGLLEADRSVTWAKSGVDAYAVTLNPATGAWTLEDTNYADKKSYAFTFTASDTAGRTAQQTVAITITDVVVTPAPAFTTQPSITPGSGTAGTTSFSWNRGTASNTTDYTVRFLLNGSPITTPTNPFIQQTAGTLVLEVTATGPGGSTVATASVVVTGASNGTIGGLAINSAGEVGTYTEGYTLSDGDDFDGPLDLVTPANPLGRYSTTRGPYIIPGSGQQPRSSNGLGGADVDPYWTGHLDSNRGQIVPSFADSITQANSVLSLMQRPATSAEQAHFPIPRPLLAAMISTPFTSLGRAPVIFEWVDDRTSQNSKSHYTGWLMQATGFATDDDLELDIEASSESNNTGDGRKIHANENFWSGGVRSGSQSSSSAEVTPPAQPNRWAIKIDESGTRTFWMNGQIIQTVNTNQAKALARSFYLLFTNHSYLAGANAWPTDATAVAPARIHWWRVWRKGTHYTPKSTPQTVRAAAGGNISLVLPDQQTLWGATGLPEKVEACMGEPNEPGGTTNGVIYGSLPTGFTYNATTRTLSGSSSTPGRLQVVCFVDKAGDTCKPHRILVEFGPAIASGSLTYPTGSPVDWDVYRDCEVGVMTPKTVTVTGLPAGLSYSASTGKITGTPSSEGTATVTVTCTNSVGQSASVQRSLTIAAAGSNSITGGQEKISVNSLANLPQLTATAGAEKLTIAGA